VKTFEQWLTEHEKAKKLKQHIPKPPAGVRDIRDDLSKDYPGDLENMGVTEPFKVLKAGNQIPRPKYVNKKNEGVTFWGSKDEIGQIIQQLQSLDKPSRIEALEGGLGARLAQSLMQKNQGVVDVAQTTQYLMQQGLEGQEVHFIINQMR